MRRYHEQFQWPLAAAMLLLLAEMFLPERRTPARREPEGGLKRAGSTASQARPRVPAAMLVILLLLAMGGNAAASPAQALRDYQAGNYTNALAGISTAGAEPDERPAAGLQRRHGGVSRDEF